METNPYLRETILEVVDNQLRDNKPPETRQAYERLMAEGHSSAEAKRLIGCVLVGEIFDMMKKHRMYDAARYTAALARLPELPPDSDSQAAV